MSWQKPESDGGKAISHYQLEVRENKMTEFVKGKVFTIAEVRENKEGQILAKVVFCAIDEHSKEFCRLKA